MCDHLSLYSLVDQMYTHASKLERIHSGELREGNDFYLRLRDYFMIWNSPNLFDFQKSCTK